MVKIFVFSHFHFAGWWCIHGGNVYAMGMDTQMYLFTLHTAKQNKSNAEKSQRSRFGVFSENAVFSENFMNCMNLGVPTLQ